MDQSLDSEEFHRSLTELRQALPRTHAAMEEVRRRVELCWPRRPSLRVLDSESHDLCKAATQLVVAGGLGDWGLLPLSIEAGKDTLDAVERQRPEDLPVDSWDWALSPVDRDAAARPDRDASAALRSSVFRAEESNCELLGLLDEINRLSPQAWLPEWDLDDARAYIDKVKWRRATSRRMRQAPHWYTVRAKQRELTLDFLAFARLIRSRGKLKSWGRPAYVRAYLELDGWEYWTMGAPLPETTVINRAVVGGPAAAQPLPPELDAPLLQAVERSLAYLRIQERTPGTLGERLRSVLTHPST